MLALAATLVLIPATTVGAQSGDEAILEQARERVAEVERQLDAAEERSAEAGQQLAEAEQRLAELEQAVNEVAAALERQERRVAQAELELEQLRARAEQLRQDFEDRAVSMFKRGGAVPLEVLLASGDLDEAIDRGTFLSVLNEGEAAVLEGVENTRIAIDEQQALLAAERDRLARMKEEQEALLAEVQRLRDSRALAAANASAEVEELAARKEDLEDDEQRIAELIRTRQFTPGSVALPSTSGYVWPSCGSVTSEFGYRWGRLHAGLDVDDNRGTKIGSAKEGVVIFVGWQGGYGRLTLVDHGDGVVTAYAHQSQQVVSEGQRVDRGQYIGDIGNTGQSTGSHLHFETRVNGNPVNPRRFLPGSC